MSMRLTYVLQNNTQQETTDPIQFETTYDGQTFVWGPGQMRSFADDGQAIGHAGNSGSGSPAAGVVEDNAASKKQFPNSDSRS